MSARMICMYICMHVCECMLAPRCRARFTLYGHEDRHGRMKRITWRTLSAAMCNRRCPFARLPGSARHEGEPIKPAMGGGRRQGEPQQLPRDRKGAIFGASGIASSLFCILHTRALKKLAKWSTCGAEPKVMKNQNLFKGPFQAFQNPHSGFQADLLFRYSGGRHGPRVPQQSVPCDALV